jgi:phosphoribosylformylglycinamidine cyclo-ligase
MRPRGLAHITGGGLPGNLDRILPQGLAAHLDPKAWPLPPIFSLIQEQGQVARAEMFRTFNMGIGMVAAVAAEAAAEWQAALEAEGLPTYVIGEVVPAIGQDELVTIL